MTPDPDEWQLDEDFISAAAASELTAEERADKAARIRYNHERLAAQGQVLRPSGGAQSRSDRSKSPRTRRSRVLGIPPWVLYATTLLLVAGFVAAAVQVFR
ncbi:unannotated protein [freshwater metagenome]|uniref:Unannotated protein n=1 Tax=freshwater metagenome TaxID=449393 RepID=A0A6J7BY11_9ZZZZ|nr:hypothetical protein [Actinomycetota bacterium]